MRLARTPRSTDFFTYFKEKKNDSFAVWNPFKANVHENELLEGHTPSIGMHLNMALIGVEVGGGGGGVGFSFPFIPSPGIHDKTMTFGLTFCKYVSRFIQKEEPTNRKLSCVSSDTSLVATRMR